MFCRSVVFSLVMFSDLLLQCSRCIWFLSLSHTFLRAWIYVLWEIGLFITFISILHHGEAKVEQSDDNNYCLYAKKID